MPNNVNKIINRVLIITVIGLIVIGVVIYLVLTMVFQGVNQSVGGILPNFNGLLGLVFVAVIGFTILVSLGFGMFFRRLTGKLLATNGNSVESNDELRKTLSATGVRAIALIKDITDSGITVNRMYIKVGLVLEVQPTNQAPFAANMEMFVSRVKLPRVGDKLEVIFDQNDHSKIVTA